MLLTNLSHFSEADVEAWVPLLIARNADIHFQSRWGEACSTEHGEPNTPLEWLCEGTGPGAWVARNTKQSNDCMGRHENWTSETYWELADTWGAKVWPRALVAIRALLRAGASTARFERLEEQAGHRFPFRSTDCADLLMSHASLAS